MLPGVESLEEFGVRREEVVKEEEAQKVLQDELHESLVSVDNNLQQNNEIISFIYVYLERRVLFYILRRKITLWGNYKPAIGGGTAVGGGPYGVG